MSRKGFNPFILLDWVPSPPPEETEVPGIDTGSGHVDPPGGGNGGNGMTGPVNFENWRSMYAVDIDRNGTVDLSDYAQWWIKNGYDMDAWEFLNPGLPFSISSEADVSPRR